MKTSNRWMRLKVIFTDLGLLAKFVFFCLLVWIGIEVGLWVHEARTENQRRETIYNQAQQLITDLGAVVKNVNDQVVKFDRTRQNVEDSTAEMPSNLRELKRMQGAVIDFASSLKSESASTFQLARSEIAKQSNLFAATQKEITGIASGINKRVNGPEVEQMIKDAAASSQKFRIYVESPEIKEAIENTVAMSRSGKVAGGEIEVLLKGANESRTTFERTNKAGAALTEDFQKFMHPKLNPDPVKGFWKKLGNVMVKGLGYARDGALILEITRSLR